MPSQTFVIRVDSSREIGTGHVARCLTLANALAELNAQVIFICRNHHGSVVDSILQQRYKLHLLKGKNKSEPSLSPNQWLGCSQLMDASESSSIISEYADAKVIVDHYSLDYLWERNVGRSPITVIDDLANRRHTCSLLIDQSLRNKKEDYRNLIDCSFEFIGGDQIILRDEFVLKGFWKGTGKGRILICMGGTDPQNYTKKILKNIVLNHTGPAKYQGIREITVVAGSGCGDLAELVSLAQSADIKVSILPASQNMSELMLSSEICILSCGNLILEACALGVPSVGIAVADNQKGVADFLSKSCAIELYNFDDENIVTVYEVVANLMNSPEVLRHYSKKSRGMVSSSATQFIARRLCES